jgi:hypothetical protein
MKSFSKAKMTSSSFLLNARYGSKIAADKKLASVGFGHFVPYHYLSNNSSFSNYHPWL